MKVLVYGAGVIGGQIIHTLCACGHDVTVIARGAWAETLRENGLRIRHYLQKKDTTDHPRILEKGDGSFTVGGLHEDAAFEAKAAVARLFTGSKCGVTFCDNMDSWLKYHAAFILPVIYLSYAADCDLRRATREQRKLLLDASEDAYRLLMRLGYPVRPAGDEESFKGAKRKAVEAVIYVMAKTKIGALCTTEHCKNAPQEMEDLDAAFLALREKAPDFPMPSFDRLRAMMPAWERVRKIYGGKK